MNILDIQLRFTAEMALRPKLHVNRRRLLIGVVQAAGLLLLAGCDNLSRSDWFTSVLRKTERVTQRAQRLISLRKAMAKEFSEADLSSFFPPNGNRDPENPEYQRMAQDGFADWKLEVGGLVQRPMTLSLTDLQAMPSRTQITRHDCVEGWSAIGKWKGTPLSRILEKVQPLPAARYVVFHCADPDEDGTSYYESIDLDDAFHAQTILAYEMNDQTLPTAHACGSAWSASSATNTPSTSCGLNWSRAWSESAEDGAGIGRIRGMSGTRGYSRMLKKTSSGVLASPKSSTYLRGTLPVSSSGCGLAGGLFEHSARIKVCFFRKLKVSLQSDIGTKSKYRTVCLLYSQRSIAVPIGRVGKSPLLT